MFAETVKKISENAGVKSRLAARNPGKYAVLSMAAGFYIGIAVFVMYAIRAPFTEQAEPYTKIVGAAAFSVGLILCVFAGSELFTGNVLFVTAALIKKTLSFKNACAVLLLSFFGNFLGALLFSLILYASGLCDAPISLRIAEAVAAKARLAPLSIFSRGILCNVLVCLSVWTALRVKTDGAKFACLVICVFTFVISGYAHCVADMTQYILACFLGVPVAADVCAAFLMTVLGNIAGGALVAAGYCLADAPGN